MMYIKCFVLDKIESFLILNQKICCKTNCHEALYNYNQLFFFIGMEPINTSSYRLLKI